MNCHIVYGSNGNLSPFNRVKSSHISMFFRFFLKHFLILGVLWVTWFPFRKQPFGIWVQAMWQIDALHDLQPMWIFDPEMMGGQAGDPLVKDGQVLHHSYRSFLTTRCLAVHMKTFDEANEGSGWIFLKKWSQRKETDSKKKERRLQKWTFFWEGSVFRGQIEVTDTIWNYKCMWYTYIHIYIYKPVEVESGAQN